MRINIGIIVLSVIIVSVFTFLDKQLSYDTDFSWRTFNTSTPHTTGWQITKSQRDSLTQGTKLTHILIDDQWQPLDAYVLSPVLDFVSNTQGLLHILEIEQKLYAQTHTKVQFKTQSGDIINAYYKPTTWGQLSLDFYLYRAIFLCSVLFALWAVFFYNKQQTLHIKGFNNRANPHALRLIVLMLMSLGIATAFSIERKWALPKEYIWGRFLAAISLICVFEAAGLRLLLLQPNNLLTHYKTWRYIWWGWLIVPVSSVTLLCIQHPIAISFMQNMFSIFPFIYLAAFIHQAIFAYTQNKHLVDKLSIRAVFIFNLVIIALTLVVDFILKQFYLDSGVNPDLINLMASLLLCASLLALIFRYELYRFSNWWWIFYACLIGSATTAIILFWLSDWGINYKSKDLILSISLGISVALALGFGFLALRFKNNIQTLYHSSELLQSIKQLPEENTQFWESQRALFINALDIKQAELIEVYREGIHIEQGGEAMTVHLLDNLGLKLTAPDKGRRLFNDQDIKILTLLQDLSLQKVREKNAILQGEEQARLQVASDLHDDIGSRLHQLANVGTEETTKYAQQTLEQLRALTHALHKKPQSIEEFFSETRHELQRHCEAYEVNISIDIHIKENLQSKLLNPMSIMQIRAILSELTRNGLQHENVDTMTLNIKVNPETTHIDLYNNGTITQVENWIAGVGTVSIKRRANQMHGEINWLANSEGGATAKLIFKTQKWLML